jgi:pimeloyl-ACP methyl ester carboxylesterase
MVAPSIDPGLEKLRWYNQVASWRLLNWALPGEWLTSNREILPLKKELQAIEGDWHKIACPVILIQGEADELVPPKNADFAERMLPGRVKVERIPGVGHFVLWEQPRLTVAALLELLAP